MRNAHIVFILSAFLTAALAIPLAAAQAECPSECSCLSIQEYVGTYGDQPTTCQGRTVACDGTDQQGNQRICLQNPSQPQQPGSIDAGAGSSNPGAHSWFYDPDDPDIWNEMLQIKLTAAGEDVTVDNVTLQAAGTGDDKNDISRAEFYLDGNANGKVDEGDVKVATSQPAYNADNDKTTTALNFNVAKGETKYLLVAYIMASNAPVGKTYSFTVTAIGATGKTSKKNVNVANLPISSGAKSTSSPVCRGNLNLTLSPNPQNISQLVTAKASGLKDCTNKRVNIFNTQCNFLIQLQALTSCVAGNGKSCDANFTAPDKAGTYTYYACLDQNQNGNVDAGEQASANLTARVPTSAEKPAEDQQGQTGQPGEPQCGDCTPESFSDCKTPFFSNVGTQSGTCKDLCGNVLTKTKECEITVEKIPPALPEDTVKIIIGNKDYGGPGLSLLLLLILVVSYLYFTKK